MGPKYPIRSRIFFSIVNGSGTRATARTLGIAKDTVTDALRSIEASLWYVNDDYLKSHQNGALKVECVSVKEVEMDEMWRRTARLTVRPIPRREKSCKSLFYKELALLVLSGLKYTNLGCMQI